jgi:hypothetical protein
MANRFPDPLKAYFWARALVDATDSKSAFHEKSDLASLVTPAYRVL